MQLFKVNIFIIFAVVIQLTGCAATVATGTATGFAVIHDRRTTGALIDDQTIKVKANLAITKDKELCKQSHINAFSYNNTLLLVGQTQTLELKQHTEDILASIQGIKEIYNEITIEKPVSLTTRIKDSWITAQLKAKLLTNRNIGPNRITVVTENGTVYLMGILAEDEENLAVDVARKISGVKQVIKIISQIPDSSFNDG